MVQNINATTSNLSTLFSTGNAQKSTDDLFLKIFSTEMATQNPLSPMDNQEWIQQLVQFSSFNQMTSMNEQLRSMKEMLSFVQATNLVGKEVTYTDDSQVSSKGVVQAVSQKNGQIYLVVDKKEIPFDKIHYVEGGKV